MLEMAAARLRIVSEMLQQHKAFNILHPAIFERIVANKAVECTQVLPKARIGENNPSGQFL